MEGSRCWAFCLKIIRNDCQMIISSIRRWNYTANQRGERDDLTNREQECFDQSDERDLMTHKKYNKSKVRA